MLVLILARRGSTRFPNKNVVTLSSGTNMVERTVQVALQAFPQSRIIISTDYTPEELFANCPDLYQDKHVVVEQRPAELCKDDTTSEEVVEHMLKGVNGSERSFVLMQPTSPCRRVSELVWARSVFEKEGLASLVAVNPAMQPNGSFYFCTIEAFRRYGSWWNHATSLFRQSYEESVDVNFLMDMYIAEAVMWRRVHGGGV